MLGLLRSRCLLRRGGGAIFSNPTKTNLFSTPNHRYVFSFLQVSSIGDYFTYRALYETEDESDAGEVEGPERKKKIKKGDKINLHDLLFTKDRDYLLRYQNNQRVKADDLAAKVLVIYFTSILNDQSDYFVPLLENLYNDLYPQNGFEVIFVAVKDVKDDADHDDPVHYRNCCKHLEEEILSLRPWTAIPLSDIPSENSLERKGFPEIFTNIPAVLIVDSTGMVLQCHDAYYILELYGALGYPFSDERIKYLQSEDDAIAMQPSLQSLLASPQRDYVISNKGDKVPIYTLEDKVVALYFYEEDVTDDSELKMAYEKLKKNNENFEVVLIYDPDKLKDKFYRTTEESFWKTFKTMPWLALPLNDTNDRKLKRILEYSLTYISSYNCEPDHQVTRLVIFGPRGEFIEPFGANILNNYGIRAYPFTFEKLVKLEIEKVNNMKLEMLWNQNTVFTRKDGSEVPVSQLAGKNVIVFFEYCGLDSKRMEFLKMLKERYLECRGTDDEFEVIHILKKEERVSKHVGYLPWVVSELLPVVDPGLFYVHHGYGDSSFVFFDGDGRVVRKNICPSFESTDFPFSTYGLEKEAWIQLENEFHWKSWYGDVPRFGRPRIYSLEKMNAPASLQSYVT